MFASESNEDGYNNDTTDDYYPNEQKKIISWNEELHLTSEGQVDDSKLERLQGSLQRVLKPLR